MLIRYSTTDTGKIASITVCPDVWDQGRQALTFSLEAPDNNGRAHPRLEQCLQRWFAGDTVVPKRDWFDFSGLTEMQVKAVQFLPTIPRGKVIAYGTLANRLRLFGAARAIGSAMARNPFPLLFPCHRVVHTGGRPGPYSGGGPEVKQRLLDWEGICFDSRGRIPGEYFLR